MGDKRFTLVELHLTDGDLQIGPRSLGETLGAVGETDDRDERVDDDETDAAADADDETGCLACAIGKLLVVLALLGVVAAVATKYLSEDAADELAELDQ
ncbi:hypothetical protein ACNS7O_00900 [Haloferacaceae archaeon DSL9]